MMYWRRPVNRRRLLRLRGSKSIIRKGTTMEMKKNVGASDRYVRTIIGLGFIMNDFFA